MKLRFISIIGCLHMYASLQVRSIGAESDRAYQGGPLEWDSNRAYSSLGEGSDIDLTNTVLPSRYTSMLDWFAVDLEGEHSAMDGRILQEHSEYVVYAIHRVPLFTHCMNYD